MQSRTRLIAGLGMAQTLAWASSYYLPAILAVPMARDIGVSTPTVFAAFSLALVVSALLGPVSGKLIDRYGGRRVLAPNSLIFALSLAAMAFADSPVAMFAAWALLGVAMSAGLYESAFASLVRLYGRDARGAITGITLFAGFASTIGWPFSAWLELHWGWRNTCLTWAGLHLLLALPLNLALPSSHSKAANASGTDQPAQLAQDEKSGSYSVRSAALLAFVFAVTWFISTAMAAHLPRLLQAHGVSLAGALLFAGLIGPAQVAGRLLEYGLLRNIHPLVSARIAGLMHALGATIFLIFGGAAGAVFTVLHGAGNGILTIANGTLPLALFGSGNYGTRQGLMMVPARFAQASSPWLFGLAIDRFGTGALWFSTALGLLGFTALVLLRRTEPVHQQAQKH